MFFLLLLSQSSLWAEGWAFLYPYIVIENASHHLFSPLHDSTLELTVSHFSIHKQLQKSEKMKIWRFQIKTVNGVVHDVPTEQVTVLLCGDVHCHVTNIFPSLIITFFCSLSPSIVSFFFFFPGAKIKWGESLYCPKRQMPCFLGLKP